MVRIKRRKTRKTARNTDRRKPAIRKVTRRRKTRRNPVGKKRRVTVYTTKRGKVYGTKKGVMRRGTRVNPRRRRKYVRQNPFALKKMLSKDSLMNMATIGGGIAAGFFLMPVVAWASRKVIEDPEKQADASKYLGAVHVVLGFVLGGFAKNARLRQAAMVVSATGAYDLIVNIAGLEENLPALPRMSKFSTTVLDKDDTAKDGVPVPVPVAGDYVGGDYAALSGNYSDALSGESVDDVYAIAGY